MIKKTCCNGKDDYILITHVFVGTKMQNNVKAAYKPTIKLLKKDTPFSFRFSYSHFNTTLSKVCNVKTGSLKISLKRCVAYIFVPKKIGSF